MPDIHTTRELISDSTRFYADVIGMEIGMDLGWIVNLGSPDNETAQVQLMTADATAPVTPDVSIEVDAIDEIYGRAQAGGHEIVYPLTVEPWGVRRFFVRDPSGTVVNVMEHTTS